MPQFFESTPPSGDKITYGPFPTPEEAEACKAEVETGKPDHVVGDVFSESSNYLNSLPKPQMSVVLSDGSTQEFWTDGTTRNIPAE